MPVAFTITIPDVIASDVIAALCLTADRTPATGANAKLALVDYLKTVTTNYRVREAAATATTTAATTAATDLTGVT